VTEHHSPDYDVIVIGGGGAGLCAAITAADAGARVALLEAGKRVGGSTALAGGFVFAAGTEQQRVRGIEDSPEAMFEYVRERNGDTSPADVVRRVCEEAPRMLAWLGEIGVEFPPERLVSPNGRMVARAHEPEGFGARIIERLDYELSRRGVDLACNTRVEELVCAPDGAVSGVRIGAETVAARAVVLACGGIGGNAALLHRMLPKSRRVGDWLWHVGCETNRGDGLRMAEAVGARICGEDSGLLLATPNFHRDLEVIGPDWVLMVNTSGERIVREDAAYWELAEALEAQDDSRGFCVFDHALMLGAEPDPRVLEALAQGTISLSWIPRVLQEQLGRGRVLMAESIGKLAVAMGVDAAALERSVKRYNALAQAGLDADFGKAARCLKPLAAPPYYAVEVRPAIAIVTGAGPAIDGSTRVLRPSGDSVPGLFAAGESTGDVYGRYYVGSGYAIASALSLGRVAGREAAGWALAGRGG
jgi:fumarate reductase flavoprotein subunit